MQSVIRSMLSLKKNQEEMVLNIGATCGIPAVALRFIFIDIIVVASIFIKSLCGVWRRFLGRIKRTNANRV